MKELVVGCDVAGAPKPVLVEPKPPKPPAPVPKERPVVGDLLVGAPAGSVPNGRKPVAAGCCCCCGAPNVLKVLLVPEAALKPNKEPPVAAAGAPNKDPAGAGVPNAGLAAEAAAKPGG